MYVAEVLQLRKYLENECDEPTVTEVLNILLLREPLRWMPAFIASLPPLRILITDSAAANAHPNLDKIFHSALVLFTILLYVGISFTEEEAATYHVYHSPTSYPKQEY